MDPLGLKPLGRSGVRLPALGLGGAPLGNLFSRVPEADAEATLEAAWDAGVRFYDTSPWYGRGLSEHRFGHVLRQKPRDELILSTKVGRVFRAPKNRAAFRASARAWEHGLEFEHVHDYSYDGIMRSYEDSLTRLGLNRIDLLVIHDLDLANMQRIELVKDHMVQLSTSGIRALDELKASGEIRAYGAGVNRTGTIPMFLDRVDLDFFLVALPYTLAEQPVLDAEFPLLEKRGIGVVIGGVFASGILATGPVPGATYNYGMPTPEQAARVRRMGELAQEAGTSLAAAALHFTLHHPVVASVIPGAIRPEQVLRNIASMRQEVPARFWAALKAEGLLREDAPTP